MDTSDRDEIMLVSSIYEDKLANIKPNWGTLRICLQDIWRTEDCELFNITVNYKDPNSRLVKLESLMKYWEEYDLYFLSSDSAIYFVQSLTAQSDSYLSWTISLAVRRTIADIWLQITIVNQNGIKKVLFILSTLFYSAIGNKVEDLLEFKNEKFQNTAEVIEWMKLRVTSLHVLVNTIDKLNIFMIQSGIYLVSHYLGSQTKLVMRTWSLAYHQEYVFIDLLRYANRLEERYPKGEAHFYARFNDYYLYGSLHRIAQFFARRALLYTGISFIGEENVLTYVVRTSYDGILSSLNKSNGNNDTDDEFSNYIFEPVKPKMNWVKWIVLEFPPAPDGWDDNEYIFVVTAVKHSLTKYDLDSEGNPMVNLFLTDRFQKPIELLPQGYNISIPYIDDGGQVGIYVPKTRKIGYLKIGSDHRNPSKYLFLSSLNLPNHLRNWRLKIILEPGVTIKAVANVKFIPEYEDVDRSPELEVYTDGSHYSLVDIHPVEGSRLIPSRMYIGILPVKLPNPTVSYPIRVQSSLYYCSTFNSDELESSSCEGLYQPHTLQQNYFNCSCVHFGLVYTTETYLTGSELLAEPLKFEIRVVFNRDATLVVGIAAALLVLVLAFVLWKDRRRHGESLIYLEDNYIKDTHILIVGVYTSPRCSAGTDSKVAIKVEGTNSSSRVHLLWSSKRQILQAGQDDWFVMTTNVPLGRLYRITLWVDFRSRDDWYCTRILFYDVNLAKWSYAEVNKWIHLSEWNEESRICTFQITELDSADNALNSLPYGFCDHFSREISNTHLLASMAFLHQRSLETPFMMGNVLLIKVFSIFLLIWFLEEVAYTWFHSGYYVDYYSAADLISWKFRTFEDASSSAGIARLFTVPIITLYKAVYVSRFLQKRTTNPLYLATSSPKDLMTSSKKSSISPGKGRKSSIFTFRSRKSTRISIYRPFDTKFGLQRGWRLLATLLFGPSQFRCVNVDRSVFNNRVFTKLLILRLSTLFLMLALFASVCVIEFGTEFWRKTKSTGFIFLTALLLDLILITPSFMLISSLISYFVLKASNKEVYIFNEETKLKKPPYLDFKEYINVATREEYKPILTILIEGSRKKRMKAQSYLHFFNYLVALLAMGLCILNIGRHATEHYNTRVTATEAVSHPTELLDKKSHGIHLVNNRSNAVEYIFTNLAEVGDEWYNGKRISRINETWELGGHAQPLNSGNLFILFRANNSRNYYLSTDIQDYKELFPPPCGYLSDDSIRTDPIKIIPGKTITYRKFSPFSMTGKSKESYRFEGHNATFPTYSKNWSKYYLFLRQMIDAAINRRDNCDVRALLFSWNSVNIFSRKFLTLNVLVEFLPSGVTSAVIEVNAATFVQDSWPTLVTNGILSVIFLWNLCFVAILFSITTKHIVQFRILNSLFLIGSISISILFVLRWVVKFSTIHETIYDSPDHFRDLGIVYAYESAWSYALASVVAVTVLIMAFLILSTLSARLLKMSFHCFLCAAFMLMILVLFNSCTDAFRNAINIITYRPLFSRVDAVTLDHSAGRIWLLSIMFFITVVLLKFSSASVILASKYGEEKEASTVIYSTKKILKELRENGKIGKSRRTSITAESRDPKKSTIGDDRMDDKIALMK